MKTEDKPHYRKHAFLDCWIRIIPSHVKTIYDFTLVYDGEWSDYT